MNRAQHEKEHSIRNMEDRTFISMRMSKAASPLVVFHMALGVSVENTLDSICGWKAP
jgi:hypothetical protein